MSEMINPHLLRALYKRDKPSRWARQVYLPILSGSGYTRATRRTFVRASEAQQYAEFVLYRWQRLYDAAIVAMYQLVPVPAE